MEFKDLTPEQQERAKACKTQEEFMELADELDLDISPEQLQSISGGWKYECPRHCWGHTYW